MYELNGNQYWVYRDPGPPPMIGGEGDELYRSGFEQVLEWSQDNSYRCRRGSTAASFQVIDGEQPTVEFRFNLVDSSNPGRLEGPFRFDIRTGDLNRFGTSASCRLSHVLLYCR